MTSSIVEAQCPGCNNVLRIPASWVDQAMRCKCCGRVFQMRQAPAIPIASPVAATSAQRGNGVLRSKSIPWRSSRPAIARAPRMIEIRRIAKRRKATELSAA